LGYGDEELTHSAVARAIAEGRADVGLGAEVSALDYGLGFVPLKRERYDFVVPASLWSRSPLACLAEWLASDAADVAIGSLGGYDLSEAGRVRWVD
jgi:molybdate-binding protein